MTYPASPGHDHRHAFTHLNPREPEGLVALQPPQHAQGRPGGPGRADAARPAASAGPRRPSGPAVSSRKSVILLWMAGGPSHIDTWDPKPDRPLENRGPFGVIADEAARRRSSASTCRSRRRCSTSSRSSARSMPGTATTSRTRSSRPATSRPSRATNPRGRHVPGHRLDRRQAPRRQPPGHAALRRVHEVAVAPGLRRLPGQAVRPVHRQPGRAAADLRPTSASTPAG